MTAAALAAVVLALLAFTMAFVAVVVGRRELALLVDVEPAPLASPLLVVVPARDEAARIGPLLDALAQEPHARVLVVDDGSTDGTGDLARAKGAEVLRLDGDPPPGVHGKPRALAAAVAHARERGWVSAAGGERARALFLDADVRVAPGTIGGLVRALDDSGAHAMSGLVRLEHGARVEEALVPALISVVTGRIRPSQVHDPADATAFLNGQVILVDVAALDDAGGWTAVQGSVLEDVALAKVLKAKGHALRLADLRALVSTRMYDSLRGIVDGFGKNATALLGARAGLVGIGAFVVSLFLPASLVLALSSPHVVATPLVLLVVTATVIVQLVARRMAQVPLWPVVVLPLVYFGVAWVLLRASVKQLAGRPMTWKGRAVGGSSSTD